jgi:hypothetical protein
MPLWLVTGLPVPALTPDVAALATAEGAQQIRFLVDVERLALRGGDLAPRVLAQLRRLVVRGLLLHLRGGRGIAAAGKRAGG